MKKKERIQAIKRIIGKQLCPLYEGGLTRGVIKCITDNIAIAIEEATGVDKRYLQDLYKNKTTKCETLLAKCTMADFKDNVAKTIATNKDIIEIKEQK